jgi:hypothetical protein
MQLYGLVARVESQFIGGDNEKTPPLTYDSQCFLHVGSFDGPIVGIGHGTANSWEKRYRRDSRLCPNCNQAKIIRSKWPENIPADQRGWYCLNCKSKFDAADESVTAQEVGTGSALDAFDLGVTLMKMSEKRAVTDGVLRATATSGLFTQDVAEDPPETVVTAQEAETTVRYEGAAQTTREGGDWTQAEGSSPVPIEQAGYTESDFQQVVVATGGEEVVVGPSAVENVERGGRTAGANEPQIAEVRRLATELGWGSKVVLSYVYALMEAIEPDVPEDGRVARGVLSDYLDRMSSEDIGKLITSMQSDLDLSEQADRAEERSPEQVDHE